MGRRNQRRARHVIITFGPNNERYYVMQQFTAMHHQILSGLFDPARKYSGYKPDMREIPNGDGVVDARKRYLHVARKYADRPDWTTPILAHAHWLACEHAERIGVPDHMYPRVENSDR